jgi:hypothetical protein
MISIYPIMCVGAHMIRNMITLFTNFFNFNYATCFTLIYDMINVIFIWRGYTYLTITYIFYINFEYIWILILNSLKFYKLNKYSKNK